MNEFLGIPIAVYVIVAWLLLAYVGSMPLDRYGRSGRGFLLCLILGFVGVFVCLVMRRDLEREESQRWHEELLKAIREQGQT
jgi:uncharacterized membrane protein YeaQ/YmgE (transglycosylase-associated protein family)